MVVFPVILFIIVLREVVHDYFYYIWRKYPMSAKNTTQVLIGGKIVTLSGYESEDYLQKVAAYINHKLSELNEVKGFVRLPADTRHTMLSLNVADDYFKAKMQAEVYEEDLQAKDKELYDLKHELVSLQMQLDKLQKNK